MPLVKNRQPFDSFFLLEQKQIAIKTTLSLSHSLESEGLTVLKELRPGPDYELYYNFVVPTYIQC